MKKRPLTAGSCRKRICPLSDPSVGIISENDHKVGLCLCRYCDCGEHKCPTFDKHEVYLKSSFKSIYQHEFKGGPFDSPLKPDPKLFYPNPHKMDLQTTNQIAYKPFRISPKKQEEKNKEMSKATFRGYSQYVNDFPNWGENKITHEKRWYAPLRTTELAFSGKSTYKEVYNDQGSEKFRTDGSQLAASKSSISFAPKDKFDGMTTYAKNMRDYSHNSLNHRIVVNTEKSPEIKVPKNHFQTTTKNYFTKNNQFSPDPRLFKMALINRSVSASKNKEGKKKAL